MREPIWDYLRSEGRSIKWLAAKVGFSYQYVRLMSSGVRPVTPEFRRRAAELLGKDESDLFLPECSLNERTCSEATERASA